MRQPSAPTPSLAGRCLAAAVAVSAACCAAAGAAEVDTATELAPAATHTPPLPFYTGPRPDILKPLAGFQKVRPEFNAGVYFGSAAGGWYNHAAMWHYHDGLFTLSWKNAPETEDTPGQRVLYSQSEDGQHWSAADVLFPNMSTAAQPAAQFAGPYAVLNGHLYATATPAIISLGDAQGAQWCLWPDGLDPRNCATPDRYSAQPNATLMMRRIYPGAGTPPGPVFWVSPHAPAPELREASELNSIQGIHDMDLATQEDVALLSPHMDTLPCTDSAGTLKCEGCRGGCQVYSELPKVGLANERTHWDLPNATRERYRHAGNYTDVIAYRSHSAALFASVRSGGPGGEWSPVNLTDVPNDDSNINAGVLPDGRIYLVANAAPHTVRDPLTVTISDDGLNFSSCRAVQTCHDLLDNSTCTARYTKNHNVGPSYPQGLVVVDPAPEAVRGFYVVATNNKEDVVVTKVSFSEL